jgi:hypothetical protein
MKKFLVSVGIVGLVMVSVLAVVMTSTAWAQGETPPTPAPDAPGFQGGSGRGLGGFGFGRGLGGQTGLEAVAKVLGMTTDELSAQLWGGRNLADLAEKAGVKIEDVKKAVEDANLAAMKDAIEQAVTDGKLTREKADWLLQGLDKGYWGGPGGMGCFGGRGGFKGSRRGGMPVPYWGGTRFAPPAKDSTDL